MDHCNGNCTDSDTEPDDPMCNYEAPINVAFEEVVLAANLLKDILPPTPTRKSHMSSLTGIEIYLKNDFFQYTGSFKERGARYSLSKLNADQRKKGVIAASAGNHAQAMSYHGNELDIPVTVVMPIIAPIMKIQKCRDMKANVLVQGKDMKEAKNIALRIARKRGLVYINGYDHPDILAGQGTCGLEILDQIEDIDAIVVPTGGGGLLAGVSLAVKHVKPTVQIIGVESERCPGFTHSITAGKPVLVDTGPSLADGLSVPLVGCNAFETARHYVDKMVTVREEWIALAILRLIELEKVVVEGAGATGLAAVLSGKLNELKGKRVVLILSGGNIDTTILGRCLERGLAADGRLIKFKVSITDRPGGLAKLCKLIESIGVSIKDVLTERAWVTSDVFSVCAKVVAETRDREHSIELRNLLRSNYKKVYFVDLNFDAMEKSSMIDYQV